MWKIILNFKQNNLNNMIAMRNSVCYNERNDAFGNKGRV